MSLKEGFWSNFFDGAGTPRLEQAPSTTKHDSTSTSGTIGVALDPYCKEEQIQDPVEEVKIPTLKVDGILGLGSPDQAALPTRRVTWGGRESFTPTDGPSRFFPPDVCSDSSSSCAEDEEVKCEEPGPASMSCPSDTADTGDGGEDKGHGESVAESLVTPDGAPLTVLKPHNVVDDRNSFSVQVCAFVCCFHEHLPRSPADQLRRLSLRACLCVIRRACTTYSAIWTDQLFTGSRMRMLGCKSQDN